ncbi:MAG: MATE family efflux transporter [Oscillospiraceae bacterium]|nr:MATE family efflux transporter [Oscillospiraceae bacterium]
MRLSEDTRVLFKRFFPLFITIALQRLFAMVVNVADNFMLGAYSQTAMSGAAMVNQIQYVLLMLVSGIGVGVSVLGAQYWGKRETEPIRKIISVGLKVSIASGLVFFLACTIIPEQVVRIFTNEDAVVAESLDYLRIIRWTYILFSISALLMYSLQSVQTGFIGTVMSASTIVINVCLNYCFIYGNFGFPEMGIRGAAIATLASRSVEVLIVFGYIFFIDKKLRLRPKHLLSFDMSYLGDFVKVSLPVMITGILWGVGQSAHTAIIGHMGETAIAAGSIATVLNQLFISFSNGSVNAASVTIGKTIGEGRMDLVKPYTRKLQLIFIILGIISGLILFLLRDFIISLYKVTPEAREMAYTFINILCVSVVGTCYEFPVESGIIAGGGDTKYAAIVDNCFIWLFVLPGAFLSAYIFHWPPMVTYMFLKSDQILKCIPNSIRCNRYKWVRDLTRPANQ